MKSLPLDCPHTKKIYQGNVSQTKTIITCIFDKRLNEDKIIDLSATYSYHYRNIIDDLQNDLKMGCTVRICNLSVYNISKQFDQFGHVLEEVSRDGHVDADVGQGPRQLATCNSLKPRHSNTQTFI